MKNMMRIYGSMYIFLRTLFLPKIWDNFKFQDLDPPHGLLGSSAATLKPWGSFKLQFNIL